MNLKDLLLEIESPDADYMAREEADNAAFDADYEEFNDTIVTIILNDTITLSATINFDDKNYVELPSLKIEDNENNTMVNLDSVRKKAEAMLDDKLSNEIEISI